jgi:glycosyltransferase involved in cell wall biosynthesis
VYPHANLVTYPSFYEGFGNALLEAVLYKRLVLANRYPVYNADIKPLGFKFIELDGYVNDNAVNLTKDLINDQARRENYAEHNYAIAQEYFSLEILERKLSSLLERM